MRECPWCGRKNLNVYAYCQSCGRGFEPPDDEKQESADKKGEKSLLKRFWPFGGKAA